MISPIERIPNDKTIMPLRGEGNQPSRNGINFDPSTVWVDCRGGGIVGGGGGCCLREQYSDINYYPGLGGNND